MSENVLDKLEQKIGATIDSVGILKLQIEELKEKNHILENECTELKSKHLRWEQSISDLLVKMDNTELEMVE